MLNIIAIASQMEAPQLRGFLGGCQILAHQEANPSRLRVAHILPNGAHFGVAIIPE